MGTLTERTEDNNIQQPREGSRALLRGKKACGPSARRVRMDTPEGRWPTRPRGHVVLSPPGSAGVGVRTALVPLGAALVSR